MHNLPLLQSWTPLSLTSLSFLYVFLPLSLALYYLIPHKLRSTALVLLSLGYCFLAQPESVPVILTSAILDFAAVRLMERWDSNEKKRIYPLIFAAVKSLGFIIYFSSFVRFRTAPVLLGLTICCLSGLEAVGSAFRREIPYERNAVNFLLYCLFYPKLYAGPIPPYKEFVQQLSQIHLHSRSLSMGFGQLVQGGFKYILLGDSLIQIYAATSAFTDESRTVLSSWLMIVSLAFAVYYILGGFADMAQGLGMLYGIFLPRNFYYPYQSRGVADFFNRFNMTATAFLRRNLHEPLLKHWGGRIAEIISFLMLGALFGLWLGIGVNFLFWGLFLAIFAIAEQYIFPGFFRRLPRLITRIYAFFIALAAFTLMSGGSLSQSLTIIKSLLPIGDSKLYNFNILYLISNNWLTLLASVILCTNILGLALNWIYTHLPKLSHAVLGIINISLLIMLTSALM